MYRVRNLALEREDIRFDDGCVVSFRDGFGMVPDHHILTFQISSSYSILTHTDEQPAATPTMSEPIPTVAEPIASVSEPIPTASEPIVTQTEPVEESAGTPAAETASEEGDGQDA